VIICVDILTSLVKLFPIRHIRNMSLATGLALGITHL
jgi:hypothetical protein